MKGKSIILLMFLLFSSQCVKAGDVPSWNKDFEDACTKFDQGNYTEAIRGFEQLLASGHHNASIHFNLGNAYFRVGQTGRSILQFERASLYEPGAQDVNENLSIARERVRDNFQPLPVIFLVRWWMDLKASSTPSRLLAWLTMYLWLAAVAGFGLFGLSSLLIRRISMAGLMVSLAFAALTALMYFDRVEDLEARRSAIVLVPESEIRVAPDSASERVTLIHEGSKVEVEASQGSLVQIRLVDGRVGWIEDSAIERI
jgi:tetratricopeptide (TPR) repeat protein